MKLDLSPTLLTLTLAAALAGCAQPPATSGNAVNNATSGAAATAQATEVQRKALAQGLYELAYSPRQNAVFAVSSGGFGDGADPSKVLRLDPATLAVQAEIALPAKGFGAVLDDSANRLYVGSTIDAAVLVIDTTTNQVLRTVQLATKVKNKEGKEVYPHGFRQLVLDAPNQRIYLPGLSMEDSALYVLNTRTFAVDKVAPGFGPLATGAALDAARSRLFVSNLLGEILTVDTRSLQIVKRYDSGGDQPLNLEYDSASNQLLLVDQGLAKLTEGRKKLQPGYQPRPGNRLLVLNADTGAAVRSVATAEGPVALRLDPQHQRIYVTNRGAGNVQVFDSRSQALLRTIALPTHPNSLALDAQRNVLYVSVKNGEKDPKGAPESVARIPF